ncbi:hypothetical protein R3P38DRAFT_3204150 [Favolaschia claudopus]|uniref:Uncharacterized protein n=1 Tax=Favolaschia claudopus TaxID=2862362 RepID=A0AAW0ARI1_9AGAR
MIAHAPGTRPSPRRPPPLKHKHSVRDNPVNAPRRVRISRPVGTVASTFGPRKVMRISKRRRLEIQRIADPHDAASDGSFEYPSSGPDTPCPWVPFTL